jgi:nicotinamidase-related amidase
LQKIKFDKTIKKPEYSAFFDTDLEDYCKKKKIKELYFCGIYSGVCVSCSAVDAAYRRIWPILVTDASTTSKKNLHNENCKRFKQIIGRTMRTQEIIREIKS